MVATLIRHLFGQSFIVEGSDRHEFREFSQATEVVDVEVGDDDVVNSRQASLSSGAVDTGGIATAGVARVDENGFTSRGDEESGTAALGVNPVDAKRWSVFFDSEYGKRSG